MVTPIIRIGSVTTQTGSSEHAAPAPAEAVQRPEASQPSDSVHLSPAAMVRMLERQGRTIQEIAAFMNVTPQVVSSFLAGQNAAIRQVEE